MKYSISTRKAATYLPILILLLALAPRIWWWSQKQSLYGDELTSLSLSYCNPGWGSRTFEDSHAYTGTELRRMLYTDEGDGLKGLKADLRSLYHDNEDASHASLYYMLLRCSLTGCQVTAPDAIARRACLINFPFFLISFFAITCLLRRLWPGRPLLQSGAVAVAFLNPASISLTLLVREYALAECLFSLWGLYCVGEMLRMRSPNLLPGQRTVIRMGRWLWGALLAAGLLSTGYFNALFLGLTLIWLGWCAWRCGRLKQEWGQLILLPLMALLISRGMYAGFFSFLHDVRTEEVGEKLQGSGWLANVLQSARSGVKMAVLYVLTPVGTLVPLALGLQILRAKGRKNLRQKLRSLPRAAGLWLCALCWILAAVWLSPWKLTHYFSPALPLFLSLSTAFSGPMLRRQPRPALLTAAMLFAACSWCRPLIEHLGTLRTDLWPQQAEQIVFYAPDAYERHTLVQLSPYLGDKQTCTMVTTPAAVHQALEQSATDTLYVFGSIDNETLKTLPGYRGNQWFNDWKARYVFVKP